MPRRSEARAEYTYRNPIAKGVHVGKKVLAFGRGCIAPQATADNLRIAEKGVSENLFDHPDSVYFPFGNVNPPKMEIR